MTDAQSNGSVGRWAGVAALAWVALSGAVTCSRSEPGSAAAAPIAPPPFRCAELPRSAQPWRLTDPHPRLPSLYAPVAATLTPGDAAWWYVIQQKGRVLRFANHSDTARHELLLDLELQLGKSGESGLRGQRGVAVMPTQDIVIAWNDTTLDQRPAFDPSDGDPAHPLNEVFRLLAQAVVPVRSATRSSKWQPVEGGAEVVSRRLTQALADRALPTTTTIRRRTTAPATARMGWTSRATCPPIKTDPTTAHLRWVGSSTRNGLRTRSM